MINTNALPIGRELGKFTIESELGEGGFAITYRAFDRTLQCSVVVKEYFPRVFSVRQENSTVSPASTRHQENFEWGKRRFLDEARTLARMMHSGIARVRDYFELNGTAYLVMDLEKGESLSEVIKNSRRPYSDDQSLMKFLIPLLDALEYVHRQGIMHRDIKPSNIFVRPNGTPVLIDFGSARYELSHKTTGLTVLVTAGYSPIEQYESSGRQGPWTDLYSLGATLYELVTGKPPPASTTRMTDDTYVPAVAYGLNEYSYSFLSAVDWALQLDPSKRPQSAQEFRDRVTDSTKTDASSAIRTRIEKPEFHSDGGNSRRVDIKTIVATAVVGLSVLVFGFGMFLKNSADSSSMPEKKVVNAGETRPNSADNTEKSRSVQIPVSRNPADEIMHLAMKEFDTGQYSSAFRNYKKVIEIESTNNSIKHLEAYFYIAKASVELNGCLSLSMKLSVEAFQKYVTRSNISLTDINRLLQTSRC